VAIGFWLMGEEKDKFWINFWYGLYKLLLRCADSGGVLGFESATSWLTVLGSAGSVCSTGSASSASSAHR